MNKKSKFLTIIPLIALCLCGCSTSSEEDSLESEETTQSSETGGTTSETNPSTPDPDEPQYGAYALVGDFIDSNWNESPEKDSVYYLGYDLNDTNTKYWEVNVTIRPSNGDNWVAGLRVVEYGTWSLVLGYDELGAASTGVLSGDGEHNIKVSWDTSYKITIDMRKSASITVQQLDSDGNPILPSYDSAYILYGDFEESSWGASSTEGNVTYLAYDSSISTSKYWSVTLYTTSTASDWDASFRVVESTNFESTIADYSNLDTDNSTGVIGENNDNNICLYWDTEYDIIVDCRNSTPTITVNYAGTVLESDFYPDVARYDTISGIGRVDEIAENDDYIMGMDISSIIEVENAGGKYYDYDGNQVDLFTFLASQGVNYIRIRLWNDPYVEVGNPDSGSFQGGGNDIDTDIEIAKRAVEAGMKINLDFHYSDFWADPGKYARPRSWESLSDSAVISTAASWTSEVLGKFKEAGCTPDMVQVGNEINNGIAGFSRSTDTNSNYIQFIAACNKAVKDFDSSIKTCIHLASSSFRTDVYTALNNANVDYDIIGLSYYPYYNSHGTLSTLKERMDSLSKSFPTKEVCVVEYSYAWTLESKWEQGYGTINNTFNTQTYCDVAGYPASVQGQAQCIYDINEAVAECDTGIGSFYWEPAWLAREGTSWASLESLPYYQEYGESNATESWMGSTSWSNQALFDYEGYALQSLTVYDLMRNGDKVEEHYVSGTTSFTGTIDGEASDRSSYLPSTTTITSDTGRTHEVEITWDQDSIDALNSASAGETVTVNGSFTFNGETISVTGTYTITTHNYIQNASFEDNTSSSKTDNWTLTQISGTASSYGKYNNDGNARTGKWYFNPYSGAAYGARITQDVTLDAGTYTLEYYYRSSNGNDIQFTLYGESNGSHINEVTSYGDSAGTAWLYSSLTLTLTNAETITIGLDVTGSAGAWAHVDDFALYSTN
ncbi:MAG: glycosyl hydrolase 53 family protein [Coprobacillus sp.]|nr:glycosyl hydrolase 53 family protein [Coprobacillus sp.]